jgi:alpha-glucoside transport system substrate-binding protein
VETKKWRLLAVAAVAIIAAVVAATLTPRGSAKPQAKSISLLSLWGGSEKAAFLKVTAAFKKKTGITVNYESARNYQPILQSRITAGNPPNIAIIPSPAVLLQYAKQGALKDTGKLGISSSYLNARFNKGLTSLVTYKGKIYGVPAKGNSKSLVWYRPDQFKKYHLTPAKTWAQLLSITNKFKSNGQTPWSVGAGDGWPLTDWFEDIYIRTAGPNKYQGLFTGKVKFTDASVKKALTYMTTILSNKNVVGGLEASLGTKFVDGIGQVFGKNPKAQLYVEGGFVGGIATQQTNTKLKPNKTIASFPFPTINPKWGSSPVVYGGDYVVAFSDSSEVKQFLQYITSPAAGRIWVSTGAVTSPNKLVPLSAYKSPLVKFEAKQIAHASVIRYDGSDQLPADLGADWQGGLQTIFGKPSQINKVLSDVQKKAARAFK